MHILIMILLISLLIIVHELGHFLAAKLFGVRVVKFGIGLPIGPTLYSHKFKETEFLIHAFLFGGYVAMIDDETETSEEENEKIPLDSPLRFSNKKAWQKAIILVAGVTMNFLLAIFLIIFTALFYHKLPTGEQEVFINNIIVENNTSNIINSDIKAGDKILKINDIDVKTANQFIFVVHNSKYFDGYISQEIKNKKLEELKRINNKNDESLYLKKGEIIKLPKSTPEGVLDVNSNVTRGFENFKINEIKLTDEDVDLRNKLENKTKFKVEEDDLYTLEMVANAISDTYKPISITVLRNGNIITVNDIYTDKNGRLNVMLSTKDIYMEADNFKNIIKNSLKYTVVNTKLMLFGFKQMFTGKIEATEMHGIVLIAKVGGDVIKQNGLQDGILLTAIISINLAILNLLPIPALDGGQLLFLLIEKLTGNKLNKKKVEIINNIFFTLLLVLMVLILLNDVYALVVHKF